MKEKKNATEKIISRIEQACSSVVLIQPSAMVQDCYPLDSGGSVTQMKGRLLSACNRKV